MCDLGSCRLVQVVYKFFYSSRTVFTIRIFFSATLSLRQCRVSRLVDIIKKNKCVCIGYVSFYAN